MQYKSQGTQGKHWEYMENIGDTGKRLGVYIENTVNAVQDIGNTGKILGIHGKHREYKENTGNTWKIQGIQGKHWEYVENIVNAVENIGNTGIYKLHCESL